MGFDLWLVADPSQTELRPTLADVERIFDGTIRARSSEFHYLDVGTSTTDRCEIRYSEAEPQDVLTVSRPVESIWLWERIYLLLREFDMFMWWGEESAVVVRENVPVPVEMKLRQVRAAGPAELRSALEGRDIERR
jgi:hypothetical protein